MIPALQNVLRRPPGPRRARFDGTSSYLGRGGALTGIADGQVGLFSLWFKMNGSDGSFYDLFAIFDTTAGLTRMSVARQADNTLRLFARNVTGTTILLQTTAATFTSVGRWVHIAMWWNLATPAAGIYVNGVSDTVSTTLTADTIDYAPVGPLIDVSIGQSFVTPGGSTPTAGRYFDGSMAQLYFNSAATLDLSVENNLRKFITRDRRPMYLGSTGELVTGTAPIVFLNSPVSSWGANLGSGGAFTRNGPLVASQTKPPSTWG